MKLVITGGGGNVGTMLLRLLRHASGVGQIRAVVASQIPPPIPPYDRAEWTACRLGTPGQTKQLTDLMHGATAVVHLAWDILGTHRREAQQATNVTGTRQVVSAAVAAGVPQLVYLSSVAAYAPEPEHRRRITEDWPRTGLPGSWYSADKVAAEQLLDEAERRWSDLRVARIRPPAVLQPPAAGELSRYLLGRLSPLLRYRWLRPGILPLPDWLSCQLVHSADVADLLWLVLQARAEGAYNVAAEPVLRSGDLAAALHSRRLPMPAALLRAAMELTAAARLQPLNSSWFDLLATAPLVDTGRARADLGWRPLYPADQLLAAVRSAVVSGEGTASPRLTPL